MDGLKERLIKNLFFLLGPLILGCQQEMKSFTDIKSSGVIRVLTLNSDTTYYENRLGEKAGLEFDMINSFTRFHKIKPKWIIKKNTSELIDALKRNEGDLIAAGLAQTKGRKKKFLFGPEYQTIEQLLVCRKGLRPKSIKSLIKLQQKEKISLVIEKESSFLSTLRNLKKKYPDLKWKEYSKDSTSSLLQKVAQEKVDCTITDSHIANLFRRFLPQLKVRFSIGSEQKLSWMMNSGSSQLKSAVEEWYNEKGKSDIKNWLDHYYGFIEDFDPYDLKKFRERITTRLPKYKKLLVEASKKYNWPWLLLAAISYQESHWNPKAKSPTGVRGFMMLTRTTAKAMGVKNRIDAKESIMGGAKYLRKLEKRMPSYIPDPDRKFMTLASYNVGFAHLRDARGLAAWKNKNPNRWVGVSEVLPLLATKKVYWRLPHGYARGLEPVLYVDRIRNYYGILLRLYQDKKSVQFVN